MEYEGGAGLAGEGIEDISLFLFFLFDLLTRSLMSEGEAE